jgi:hypothetical protein
MIFEIGLFFCPDDHRGYILSYYAEDCKVLFEICRDFIVCLTFQMILSLARMPLTSDNSNAIIEWKLATGGKYGRTYSGILQADA